MSRIPDGQVVTLTPEMLALVPRTAPEPGAPTGSNVTGRAPAVSAAGGAYAGMETGILTYGLAPAGEHSVGFIAFPRPTPGRWITGRSGLIPEHPVAWGHTVQIVRVDGRIVAVRSYAPTSLLDAALNTETTPAPGLPAGTRPSVRAGTGSTPAAIYNDRFMLANSHLRSVEVTVSREAAEAAAAGLPPGELYGLARGTPGAGYTAQPAVFGQGGGSCPNCIEWAVPRVEAAVGGRVATPAGVPITDIAPHTGAAPLPHSANRGQVYRAMGGPLQVVDAAGNPVPARIATGGLSPGMRVLKVAGRVMIVYSAWTTYTEVRDAPTGQGARTAAGAVPGFVGGLAAGATAGLVCGPGALVCSIVLGGVFGFAGYLAARDLGELAYDTAAGQDQPLFTTLLAQAVMASAATPANGHHAGDCPGQGRCHTPNGERETSAPSPLEGLMRRELTAEDRQRLLDYLQSAPAQ